MEGSERKTFMTYVRDYLSKKGLRTEYDEKSDILINSFGRFNFHAEYRYFASGMPLEEIAGKIWDKIQLANNPDIRIEKRTILPMLRNSWFVKNKLREGRLMETASDDPKMLIVETVSERHDLYLIYAFDYGSGYMYLRRGDLPGLGLDEDGMRDLALSNLRERTRQFVKEGKIEIIEAEKNVFRCFVPDNLAASVLLVFDEVNEFVQKAAGIASGDPVYIIPLSSDLFVIFKMDIKEEIGLFLYLENIDPRSLPNPVISNPIVFWGEEFGFLDLVQGREGKLTIVHTMMKGKRLH
jgi:hypothetical protein